MARTAKKAETEYITPKIHVGYMIQEILVQRDEYKNQWWVVWYNHETMAGAGMEAFPSFEEASAWNEENPPTHVGKESFTRSTIIYSGDK